MLFPQASEFIFVSLTNLNHQVERVYKKFDLCTLNQLPYLPLYEQARPLGLLFNDLIASTRALEMLQKTIDNLLEVEIPENLLGQVDALSYQLENFHQVHHLLTAQTRQLKRRLKSLCVDFVVPGILMK